MSSHLPPPPPFPFFLAFLLCTSHLPLCPGFRPIIIWLFAELLLDVGQYEGDGMSMMSKEVPNDVDSAYGMNVSRGITLGWDDPIQLELGDSSKTRD